MGVVLAGGSSRRFGRDKALVELDGETLVERARRRLARVSSDVVVADAGRGLSAAARSVPDGPGRGPAAGILGAAASRPGAPLLVLACDLPDVPAALLARIAQEKGDWVVPRWEDGVEPLCALYRAPALEALAAQVRGGEHALYRLAHAGLRVRYLDEDDLRAFGEPRGLFRNLNTPQDLGHDRDPLP